MGEVAAGGGDGAAGVGINVVSEKTQRDSPKSTAAKGALRLRVLLEIANRQFPEETARDTPLRMTPRGACKLLRFPASFFSRDRSHPL